MLIEEKCGNINTVPVINSDVDMVPVEWYETNKRILHKQTRCGIPVILRFLKENPDLKDGDILWRGPDKLIVVEVQPCECLVITPGSTLAASFICYEIGNRHLPLFYEGDEFLVPFEIPLYNLMESSGYNVKVEKRKLKNPIKTTVMPHLQVAGSEGLLNKIFQLTTSS